MFRWFEAVVQWLKLLRDQLDRIEPKLTPY